MIKQDGRRLPLKSQEGRRMRVMREVLSGRSPSLIAKKFGVARASIYNWISSVQRGGLKALKTRLHGRPRKLSESQRRWLQNAVKRRRPTEFGLGSRAWTRRLIRELILIRWNIDVTITTVNHLIWELGLRSHIVRRARKR